MKTFDIDECAEFLKIDSTTVSEMAGMGELPGARIGRGWVFLEEDLVEYLRTQVRAQRRERQSTRFEKQQGEGGNTDQDNLTSFPNLPHNRRGRRDMPPDRPHSFADQDSPLSSHLGG